MEEIYMTYEYKPQGVCPSKITFSLEGNVVSNVSFAGGCDGNLKAISRVIDGMTVEQIEKNFSGIACGRKTTSCSDQLAKAVREAFENEVKK